MADTNYVHISEAMSDFYDRWASEYRRRGEEPPVELIAAHERVRDVARKYRERRERGEGSDHA